VQRYICRECGYRFSETGWNGSDDPEYVQRVHREPLNTHLGLLSNRQICVTQPTGMKNLVEVKSRIEKWTAGTTTKLKGKTIEFLWHLKKQGRSEYTIENHARFLNLLLRRGIHDSEEVKVFIAKQPWSNGTKTLRATVYKNFASWLGINWEAPKYAATEKMPFIPTEVEIDAIIAGCGKKTATLLQLLKETGARIGEAVRLKWTDIDFERRLVTITPLKGSRPRMLPISVKLADMLRNLRKKSERIFARKPSANFHMQRARLARKLGNPRLLRIHFHTLRHFKGTTEYHKTKDILHVMNVLGHKRIENTMIYINLENAIFQTTNEEFHVKVAKTPEEIKGLLETGFEYICEKSGLMFFRKRK